MNKEKGAHNPNTIDAIAHNPQTHELILIMIEIRPWDGSNKRLLELQNKINLYLEFIVDGHLKQKYPDIDEKKISIRLDCCYEPDDKTMELLNAIMAQIEQYEVSISVRVAPI